MHEMSVAVEVCRMAEAHVGAGAAAQITAVGLEVGDESGVEPDNLEFCLGVLLDAPPFRGAKVMMTRTPGTTLRLDFIEVDDDREGDRRS
jgi:Zn finger protein HypA/HybF involved in hydrogenase expression